ncbi:aceric acid hydrolase [Arachidicoccus soli]|uniref:Glycoside hydrolase family 127 protein n=1 Tax=Arachidicoccus soli TaxID=2341117 RepID=A0A386HNY0_9BACT|nr:glycoside hydrolase family 127 protein [Arachidicoccus soli]AYD47648.1 glycoside hydrolase family 127 protein [Arachidicoccus soli]
MRTIKSIATISFVFFALFTTINTSAQNAGITNTTLSPYAKLYSINMGDVKWTNGFWADRFQVCKDSMILNMWQLLDNPDTLHHAFKNFQIAAGLAKGNHYGAPFMDGDFYKWLESVAAVYSLTKSKRLDSLMTYVINVIVKAQRKDGYIHTPVLIAEKNKDISQSELQSNLSFEDYNMGHLMTAACVYYRATGKKKLLYAAEKAADFLENYYSKISTSLSRTAICPSHYMGLVELYRTTKNAKYLHLAEKLLNLRDSVKNGSDQNQDRIPFRKQTTAMGHAVRANYLYAGAADLYMETGDKSLLTPLNKIWKDVVYKKMYITGGCGALYDGVSPDGTTYDQASIQEVHQAYGRAYQLPNFTAHDETCANIGNVLWSWRMLQITGNEKYADIMELALYNSVLSGISLNGKSFLYSNPLAYNKLLPFHLRWTSKIRDPYIGLSFCCPPNVLRTIAEVNDYLYSLSDNGIYFNLYGGNNLRTKLKDGSLLNLSEITNYPWNGDIKINVKEAPKKAYSFYLRIPQWCENARIKINGKDFNQVIHSASYVEINRVWHPGDTIELLLPMPVQLMQANPLVEATKNQVAVKRGPIVYCLESIGLPNKDNIMNIAINENNSWKKSMMEIDNTPILSLKTNATLLPTQDWDNELYRSVSLKKPTSIAIQMVPYFSWANRGKDDMTVWMPFIRN